MEMWYKGENGYYFDYIGAAPSDYMFFSYEEGVARNYIQMSSVAKQYNHIVDLISENENYIDDLYDTYKKFLVFSGPLFSAK